HCRLRLAPTSTLLPYTTLFRSVVPTRTLPGRPPAGCRRTGYPPACSPVVPSLASRLLLTSQFTYLSYPHWARRPHRAPVAALSRLRVPVLRLNALVHRVEHVSNFLSAVRVEVVGFRLLTLLAPPVVPGRCLNAVGVLSRNRVDLEL